LYKRRSPLTDEQRERLRHMLDNSYTYKQMADYMGVCTDTLKRILVREGMAEFEGAKYTVSMKELTKSEKWNRPCLKCHGTDTRPKWQYICNTCKTLSADAMGLPDNYIEGFE
jgi:IS30 family transposase